jgi:hypothetical protein
MKIQRLILYTTHGEYQINRVVKNTSSSLRYSPHRRHRLCGEYLSQRLAVSDIWHCIIKYHTASR